MLADQHFVVEHRVVNIIVVAVVVVLATVAVRPSSGATCDTIAKFTSTWSTGQVGELNFKVPGSTNSWTMVMTFNKPITNLAVWRGVVTGCTSGGAVCTFVNQVDQ